ncbi:MAG: XRE family transcriptional regulator [Anaeroplasmataceae bacterium]
MTYTEFGEYFKILRIKNHEVLADAKEFLGVSSAFISAVECGKKQVPEDWFDKIVKHYNLSLTEQNELKDSMDKSLKSIKIDFSEANPLQKKVALQFQRSFDTIDEKTFKEIQELLKRSSKK